MAAGTIGITIRVVVVLLWIALFGALLRRDYFVRTMDLRESQLLRQDREESYSGIYFKNERIGYVYTRVSPLAPDQIHLEQQAVMHLRIGNDTHPLRLSGQATLSAGLRLQDFYFSLTSTFYQMQAKGTVDSTGKVHYTMNTGKDTITEEIRLPERPYFFSDQRRFLLSQGLEPGDKIKIPHFDPVTLTGKETVLEYRGREKVLIEGRIHNLHHFIENFAGARINMWLNDDGRVVKEESPAGFVFLAEPEFKARNITTAGSDLLAAVSVPLDGPMPDLAGATTLTYQLDLPTDRPANGDFALDGGRQSFTPPLLHLRMETLPDALAAPCSGEGKNLAPSPMVQAGNPLIVRAAREATAGITAPIEQTRALARWVFANIDKRPVIGIPDAVTTLSNRIGDCNEHAVLFAALARGLGIPTKIASGVMLHQGAFYYHAWNEVCIGGEWLSLDTTRDQLPADLSHIRFVEGGLDEQVKIGALLGRLRIRVVPESRRIP